MKPCRKLHETYCQVSEFQPPFGSIVKLKPFYISPPTDKEMEMCLCSKCLNPHCIYKAIKSIDLPHSLKYFLCTKFNRHSNKTVNYYNMDSTEEKCENNCKPVDIMSYLHDNMPDELPETMTSCYVFGNVSTKYYNKQGKEVFHNRTAKVDKRSLWLIVLQSYKSLLYPSTSSVFTLL